MKKIITSFISFVLVLSISFTVSVPNAYAFDVIGAASLIVSCIQSIQSAVDQSQAAENARQAVNHSWIRSYDWSNATWIEVSGDSLNDAVLELSRGGMPAKVHSTTHNGYDVYVILALGEPYNISTGYLIMSNSDIQGSYFGSTQIVTGTSGSSKHYIFYSTTKSSSSYLKNIESYLYNIRSYVSSIQADVNSIQTMLTTSLTSIYDSIDGIETSLNNIYGRMTYNGFTIGRSLYDIRSYTNTIQGRLSTVVDGTTYSVAQLLNINNQTATEILDAIYEVSGDIGSNYPIETVSAYTVDSSGISYPNITIPFESASSIVSFLNTHFQGREISVFTNQTATVPSIRFFVRSDLYNNYIRVTVSLNEDLSNPYSTYFCDRNHTLIRVQDPVYLSAISNLVTYIDGFEGYLFDILSESTTTNTILSDIHSLLQNIDIDQIAAYDVTDSNGISWSQIHIPYESGEQILSHLITSYYNRKITILSNDLTEEPYSRYFIGAWIDDNGYIIVNCSSRNNGTTTTYNYRLCDRHHNIYVVDPPSYLDLLDDFETSLSNIENYTYSFSSTIASVDTTLATMSADVTALASAVANINTSFSLGGLKISIGDSPNNPIYTTPASNDLYLSTYLTDVNNVPYTIIESPYQSTTDIIGYINSQMVGKPITLLPQRGSRAGDLIRYVDHAYLDQNNYIKVLAKTAAGALYTYFLASPELAIYQSLSDPFFDDSYVDDIENYLRTIQGELTNIEGKLIHTVNGVDYSVGDTSYATAVRVNDIYEFLTNDDLAQDANVARLVNDWNVYVTHSFGQFYRSLDLFSMLVGDTDPASLGVLWSSVTGWFSIYNSTV